MLIYVNENQLEVAGTPTVAQVGRKVKPNADIFILNGFPAQGNENLGEGDRLVLIKRGEVPPLSEMEALMSARHTPGIHAKLKKACVAIAGCGGLGSHVAVALARTGIGKIIIVDFDVVEPSNLNRQQYFVSQIGMPKVEALKANLGLINPLVEVMARDAKITPDNAADLLGTADVIVEAFDRADQKAMLVEALQKSHSGKPLILGLGMAGYGASNLLHSRSVGNLHICGDEISEAGPQFGLMAPRVGIVGSMQANQVLEILLGPDEQINAMIEKIRGDYVKGER